MQTLFGVGGLAGYGGQWPAIIWHDYFMKEFNSQPVQSWPALPANFGSAWNLVPPLPKPKPKPAAVRQRQRQPLPVPEPEPAPRDLPAGQPDPMPRWRRRRCGGGGGGGGGGAGGAGTVGGAAAGGMVATGLTVTMLPAGAAAGAPAGASVARGPGSARPEVPPAEPGGSSLNGTGPGGEPARPRAGRCRAGQAAPGRVTLHLRS